MKSNSPTRNNSLDDTLTMADLEMNVSKKSIRRGSKAIYLSAIEMQILELLLKRRNTIVTKSDIVVNVLIEDFNTDLVEKYIDRLREKIDGGFSLNLIRTAVGSGYLMSEAP